MTSESKKPPTGEACNPVLVSFGWLLFGKSNAHSFKGCDDQVLDVFVSEPLLAGGKHPPYIVLAHSPIGGALLRHICAVFVSELHKVVGSLQFLKLWRESQSCHLCDFLLLNSSAFQLSHHAALIFEALAINATDHSAGQMAFCTFRQVFWPWPFPSKNWRCDPKANKPRSQKDDELGAASLWHRHLQHTSSLQHFWLKIPLKGH